MNTLSRIYGTSLALLTDLYQLTMAYSYWKAGTDSHEAVFHVTFRRNPFRGGYAIAAGLEYVIDYVSGFRFSDDDLVYLSGLRGADGRPLFDQGFIDYLKELRLACDIDAVPEGTVVFPHEPLVRVRGPILHCQLLETVLLTLVNFQTLIATKAARVCLSARDEPVLEFGLRRAQGIDGGLSASRAAFVGGCAATSNVLAGKLFGIPVRGTHAHSWVMSFDDELSAFQAYAEAMPNNCVFLVDTYDTLQGVQHAIQLGRWLRERGHRMLGIRLDSGDLAYLSIEARKLLDEAGFADAYIVGSNDLDETLIASLKEQGAKISVWGVGTNLVTAADQPALGGVYKLAALRKPGGEWEHKIKLSEQSVKVTTPGILQVRRYYDESGAVVDVIYDELLGIGDGVMIDPHDMTRRREIPTSTGFTDLLIPVVRQSEPVYEPPPLTAVQRRAKEELTRFHSGIKRLVNPHRYPVGLEQRLHDLRTELILNARSSKR